MTTGKHKILVTGAAGFIGSHLAETLAKDENNIVYATDIKSSWLDTDEPNKFVWTWDKFLHETTKPTKKNEHLKVVKLKKGKGKKDDGNNNTNNHWCKKHFKRY